MALKKDGALVPVIAGIAGCSLPQSYDNNDNDRF